MRMSCNGCRVLRKGCNENCSIKPCLQWIKSPESQANATVFLAKFYGRAGLMNLINAGPDHLRPAIFRSLLYEACGRIVNPIYGSVGLLWSGSWQLCQNAVEAVLKGDPINQMATDSAETKNGPPFKAYDIRHVNKEENCSGSGSGSADLRKVRTRCRFKRSGLKPKASRVWVGSGDESGHMSPSHESSLSHQSEAAAPQPDVNRESPEIESLASIETAEAECLAALPEAAEARDDPQEDMGSSEIELELTLGLEPAQTHSHPKPKKTREAVVSAENDGACRMDLWLDYSASS